MTLNIIATRAASVIARSEATRRSRAARAHLAALRNRANKRLAITLAALLLATPARATTLRLLAHAAAGTLDPQINYTAQYWQLYCFTYDGLVAFRKTPGPAGTTLVPDLADALPQPEEGGLLYRFHLRPGLRFSDGRPVRATDVLASVRRLFRIRSPTAETFYGAIQGASACLASPAECTLDGVTADADTISIRLTRPDPEFLAKLALPHASILPEDAPPQDAGVTPIAGTGPYRFAAYDPNDRLQIVRNPFFRPWNADAQPPGQPDGIDYEFGLEDEAEVTAIVNGQADWMFDAPPADRLGELGRDLLDQVHLNPAPALWFVPLNVNLPPFDDIRVRHAVTLAVDRTAAVKLFGGPKLAAPACQFLPPGLPGAAATCPYPNDPARARQLVVEAGATGAPVTLVTDDSPVNRALGTYLRDVFAGIGLDAKLRSLSANVQFPYIQNSNNRVQASLTSWYADYPSAANFLLGSFGCAAFQPGSDSSPNIAGFCDRAIDAQIAQATLAQDPAAFAAADRALTQAAPAIALFSPRYVDFVSRRIDGYAYHEIYHWLIVQSGTR